MVVKSSAWLVQYSNIDASCPIGAGLTQFGELFPEPGCGTFSTLDDPSDPGPLAISYDDQGSGLVMTVFSDAGCANSLGTISGCETLLAGGQRAHSFTIQ